MLAKVQVLRPTGCACCKYVLALLHTGTGTGTGTSTGVGTGLVVCMHRGKAHKFSAVEYLAEQLPQLSSHPVTCCPMTSFSFQLCSLSVNLQVPLAHAIPSVGSWCSSAQDLQLQALGQALPRASAYAQNRQKGAEASGMTSSLRRHRASV
jgi:hypothetical protein